MLNAHEFYLKWNGKGFDIDGKHGYQCVELFQRFCLDAGYPVIYVNGAKDFAWHYDNNTSNIQKYFTKVDSKQLQDGDWVIFGYPYGVLSDGVCYGHIGMFRKYTNDAKTNAVILGQNQGANNQVTSQNELQLVGVLCCLRPKCYQKTYKEEWVKDDKGWWYRYKDGSWAIGWVQLIWQGKKDWYYFDSLGYMVKNKWLEYKGKWYYVGESGAMLTNQLVGYKNNKVYYVGSDGAMVTNYTLDSKKMKFGKNGELISYE